MATGKVKFFNDSKGYGFIKVDDSEQEVFVHITGLADKSVRLKQDDLVSFEISDGKKGANAIDVKRI